MLIKRVMGLLKPKTLSSGVVGEYWRIVQKNMNYDRQDCVVTLALYRNKESRDVGETPVDSTQLDLGKEYHDFEYKNGIDTMKNVSLKETYLVLKNKSIVEAGKEENRDENLAFFADAVDEK